MSTSACNPSTDSVKLLSDSSCDISPSSLEGVDFATVPLTITADGVNYTDDETLDVHAMLTHLKSYKGRSYTACPSVESWLSAFGEAQTIYMVAMSSGISGTYNSACAARDLYLQEHPQAKIHIFDMLSTGPQQHLFTEKLAALIREGKTFDEICLLGQRYLSKTRLFFSLESLHNFAQNGRVNKLVASAVGFLGMRIVGTTSPEGTLQPLSKCRGWQKAMQALLEQLEGAQYCGGKLEIGHVENLAAAEAFADAVAGKFPQADISIYPLGGLCSYYAEIGAVLVACECGAPL